MTSSAESTGVDALLDNGHPLKTRWADWAQVNLATHDRVQADDNCDFALDDWKKCADAGVHGVLIPTEYGGQGLDLASALLTLEGIGYGCRDNGLTFALASQIVSHQVAIERFGTDDQKRSWLPGLCAGTTIGAFAITEPDFGSDTTPMAARAHAQADGSYRISGHKSYITLGSNADLVVVFAATNPDVGGWGITAFVVPTDLPGVDVLPNRAKMGMRTTPFGDIRLTDVAVGPEARLGPEGAGFRIFSAAMEAERAFVFITQIGAMERVLDETVRFAKEREQGGAPIGDYQAVAHRIADMKLRHETARTLLYKSALHVIRDTNATLTAAITKLSVSEHAVESMLDAVRVHGAQGYVSEFEVERELRDAVGGLIYSGTSEIQRNIIARLLGLGSK